MCSPRRRGKPKQAQRGCSRAVAPGRGQRRPGKLRSFLPTSESLPSVGSCESAQLVTAAVRGGKSPSAATRAQTERARPARRIAGVLVRLKPPSVMLYCHAKRFRVKRRARVLVIPCRPFFSPLRQPLGILDAECSDVPSWLELVASN